MTKFVKYPSIDNSYREKEINKWVKRFPEIEDVLYVITEKLHGANISFLFENGEMSVFSRNNDITNVDGGFYGINTFLKENELIGEFINFMKEKSLNGDTYRFFGEFFGGGIQKGVDYGDKKIRFFEMSDKSFSNNEEFVPQNVFFYFFYEENPQFSELCVDCLDIVEGLKEALAYNSEFDSKILNVKNNIAEGIVIKPFNVVFKDVNGSCFRLKKVNEKFKEKTKVKKNSVPKEVIPEVGKAKSIVESYVTEIRLEKLFSKEGPIKNKSGMGKYIKMYIEDVHEDVLKDYPDLLKDIDVKHHKEIFNFGSMVSRMLFKHI